MKKITQSVYNYSAYFELNENNGYTVTVPALPGLVTEGKNLEDARTMTKDAILCYLQGLKKNGEAMPTERDSAFMRVAVSI